jgi:hypothetical protein
MNVTVCVSLLPAHGRSHKSTCAHSIYSKTVMYAILSMLHGHFRQTTMALPTRVELGEPHKL